VVDCVGTGSHATLPSLTAASAVRGESDDGALPRSGCVVTLPRSSTAPPDAFRPHVEATTLLPEFTLRAVILGALFGILFGAVTVYVGLRAGLTVAASIPIAVLSISILRAFGRTSILENNLVQTIGSAGESVAGGVIFT